jgi:hypothetical protein
VKSGISEFRQILEVMWGKTAASHQYSSLCVWIEHAEIDMDLIWKCTINTKFDTEHFFGNILFCNTHNRPHNPNTGMS